MQGKLTLLLLGVAAALALPSTLPSYKLVGTAETASQNQSYAFSLFETTYDEALQSCIENFNASLAALEEKAEEDYLRQILAEWGVSGVDFWLGGKWNGNNSFVWENGVLFRSDVKWGPGEPSLRTDDTRVVFDIVNSTQVALGTNVANATSFHICEL